MGWGNHNCVRTRFASACVGGECVCGGDKNKCASTVYQGYRCVPQDRVAGYYPSLALAELDNVTMDELPEAALKDEGEGKNVVILAFSAFTFALAVAAVAVFA